MRLLLDTHVLVWSMTAPERLRDADRDLIATADLRLVSAATCWELAIKQALGKVSLGAGAGAFVRACCDDLVAAPLPVSVDHAAAVEQLPPVHRDPFDRLLVAQAQVEGVTLLTADRTLAPYGDVVRVVG